MNVHRILPDSDSVCLIYTRSEIPKAACLGQTSIFGCLDSGLPTLILPGSFLRISGHCFLEAKSQWKLHPNPRMPHTRTSQLSWGQMVWEEGSASPAALQAVTAFSWPLCLAVLTGE